MANECTIERNRAGRDVATGNCNLDVQRVLDSSEFASLPPAARRALTEVLERNGDDFGLATQMKGLLGDLQRLGPDDMSADERNEMARQIAQDPSSDTIRRMRSLARDAEFLYMGRNAAMREIQDTVRAEPPTVSELLAGSNIQGPPRSRPFACLAAAEAVLGVSEPVAEAFGVEVEGLVGAGFAGAGEIAAGLITIAEVWAGIAHAPGEGLEWGRRIAHGEGFAAGMAWRMSGRMDPAPIPEAIEGIPEAVKAYREGIEAAERNWARLDPRDRAALSAGAGNGEVTSELFRRVRERTHG